MILVRLFLNLIGAAAFGDGEASHAFRERRFSLDGGASAPNLPTRLHPAQRVHRRKVHAVARDMRRDAGMPVSEALA